MPPCTQVARCSISSSSGSSAQWMSSKISTSGCGWAIRSAHSRAAQAISCWLRSPETASSTPDARPSRSATASAGQESRSFSSATSSGSSSAMPAAALTISASGQYVTPSPYGSARPRRTVALSSVGGELVDEARLAHAGVAEDGEELGAPVAHRARVGVLEQLELGIAADERRLEAAVAHAVVADAGHGPRPDGLAASDLDRADVLELEPAEGEALRAGADQDLVGLRGLLEPRGDVDGLARRERGVRLVGDDLA